MLKQEWPPARVEKFRQAGFVYVHVAILYEAAVYTMLGAGTLPTRFGTPWVWLVVGAGIAALVESVADGDRLESQFLGQFPADGV